MMSRTASPDIQQLGFGYETGGSRITVEVFHLLSYNHRHNDHQVKHELKSPASRRTAVHPIEHNAIIRAFMILKLADEFV